MHPEHELILVLEGSGYRVVGDNLTALMPGDMVFVRGWLPHMWREHSDSGHMVRALILRFSPGFGDGLFKLPALTPVKRFFENSSRGVHVVGLTRKRVTALLKQMAQSSDALKVAFAIEILALLADSTDCEPIASPNFSPQSTIYGQERMHRVFEFLTQRISQDVRLPEVARLVSLSEGAFSRYFRAHTGKTFPAFMNELRIGHSCRLLTETEKKVTEVAFECGFRNLSNFNRQFLGLKGMSPREFRRRMP